MPFTGPKLTNFGLSVLLKTQQSKTLHFTRIALGDGEIASGSMLTRKTLISEKLSVLIDAVRLSDTSASIVAQVSNDTLTEGFYFREKGVYCQDPDTHEEGLFVYDNCREEGEYINAKDSAHKVSFYLREHLTFSQTPNITFDASGNPIYVLYDDFNTQNSANNTRFTAIEESVAEHETDITQLQSEADSAETTLTEQGKQITSLAASKADKVSGATAGHLATLDKDGNIQDGGKSFDDIKAIPKTGDVNIYVSKTGSNETGDGSKSNPYLTISKALEIIKKIPPMSGNIRLHIELGEYDNESQPMYVSHFAKALFIEGYDKNTKPTIKNTFSCYQGCVYFSYLKFYEAHNAIRSEDPCVHVQVSYCEIESSPGIAVVCAGGSASVGYCSFNNCNTCVSASYGAVIDMGYDNTGSGNNVALEAHGAIIMGARDGIPNATTLQITGRGGKIFLD